MRVLGLRLELISCLVLLKADMFVRCCSVPTKTTMMFNCVDCGLRTWFVG